LYQAAHKLYFATGVNDSLVYESILDMLDPLGISLLCRRLPIVSSKEYNSGIVQHHDAVTGTEQQHVNDDYAKRLSMGTDSVAFSFASMFSNLLEDHIGQNTAYVV